MFFDVETETMKTIAPDLVQKNVMIWPILRRTIFERQERFRSGCDHAPRWFRKRLKELDPLLDVRWSFDDESWLIERWSRSDRALVTVMKVEGSLDLSVIYELEEGDTWRFPTPEAYLKWKHEKSARKRAQISAEQDEKVSAAVDSLTRKRADEFLEVERALHTGETVIMHGSDEKTMERMHEGAIRGARQGVIEPKPSRPMARRYKKPKQGD
jgi:hypothetical protein